MCLKALFFLYLILDIKETSGEVFLFNKCSEIHCRVRYVKDKRRPVIEHIEKAHCRDHDYKQLFFSSFVVKYLPIVFLKLLFG